MGDSLRTVIEQNADRRQLMSDDIVFLASLDRWLLKRRALLGSLFVRIRSDAESVDGKRAPLRGHGRVQR